MSEEFTPEPDPLEKDTESQEGSAEVAATKEPTSEQLARACGEVLSKEDCEELASLSLEEATGYAFTLLLEHGVEDPEKYLKSKGILE